MRINNTGLHRLVIWVFIFLGGVFITGIISLADTFNPGLLILAILIIFWSYEDFRHKVKKNMLRAIYKKIGFKADRSSYTPFTKYKIAQRGKYEILSRWKGVLNNKKIAFVEFDINRGTKKYPWKHRFIGAEVPTTNSNLIMQIYNRRNPMTPWLTKEITLESVDFSKHFKICSERASNAFYQLSPSAMHNLLSLSDQKELPVNIEFTEKSILVYTNRKYFDKLFNKLVSFTETMNGEIEEADVQKYEAAIIRLHNLCNIAFEALELQPIMSSKPAKISLNTPQPKAP